MPQYCNLLEIHADVPRKERAANDLRGYIAKLEGKGAEAEGGRESSLAGGCGGNCLSLSNVVNGNG